MRRPSLILALSLLFGASAFAANERRHKPSEYQEITDEDRGAARERARSRVSSWREDSCSLRSTAETCVSTVLIEMNSSVATSR